MECKRAEFELPEGVVYLDGAGRSPLLKAVREVGQAAVAKKSLPWTMKDELVMQTEVRSMFASLINAGEASSIAITPSTSYAISAAARNLTLPPGGRVLVLDDQMGSNVLPWQDLCARSGGSLLVIARPADHDWTREILKALHETSNRVGVVALPNCHWTDGSLIDLTSVGQLCRQLNIPLVVDITQSAGVMPFDVTLVKPSFVACSVHKWLLGAYGFSLLYVAPSFHQGVPLEHFERNRLGADNPQWEESAETMTLQGYPTQFESGARRFDSGGRPNPITLPMLHEALRHITKWGVEPIGHRVGSLMARIEAVALELGLDIPRKHAPHIIGIRWSPQVSSASPQDLKAFLKQHNVYISLRAGAIRTSIGVYVTEADVELFTSLLRTFFRQHGSSMERLSKL